MPRFVHPGHVVSVCILHRFIELVCFTEYVWKISELNKPFLITQVLRQSRRLVREENTQAEQACEHPPAEQACEHPPAG